MLLLLQRLYVHESIYDQFSQAFTAIMKQTKLGDGSDPSSGMGPVVNRTQFNKVNEFLLDIQKNGQKALTGGKVHEGKGYFVPLTVVDNPPDDSKVVTEEPFGPVGEWPPNLLTLLLLLTILP
jgi:acyl-CoA reductase-like NAD-dependent aldehyde dehydrogenase